MDAAIQSLECPPVSDSSAIKVTIVYEDLASGVRGKEFAERLAAQLGCGCRLSESLWRSDLLERPMIASAATRDAADCDFLIVSLRGDRLLPFAARRWIEEQLDGAARCVRCVIALFGADDGKPRGPDANRQYLRGVCAANCVELFAHTGTPPAEGTVSAFRSGKPAFQADYPVRSSMPAALDE